VIRERAFKVVSLAFSKASGTRCLFFCWIACVLSKLLEILPSVWCSFSNLLKRKQSRKTSIVCRWLKLYYTCVVVGIVRDHTEVRIFVSGKKQRYHLRPSLSFHDTSVHVPVYYISVISHYYISVGPCRHVECVRLCSHGCRYRSFTKIFTGIVSTNCPKNGKNV